MMVGQQVETMANPEHLAKLNEGVDAWNKWRDRNPDTTPDLVGANLSRGNLVGANLTSANATGGNFSHSDLTGANLSRASLSDAGLDWVTLFGANLLGANLFHTNFSGANLVGANLIGANITQAVFFYATLTGAKLDESDMSQATIGLTAFGDNDFRGVKGLDTVRHDGPSTIGIDTIYRSQGKIPELFLRGCGALRNLSR